MTGSEYRAAVRFLDVNPTENEIGHDLWAEERATCLKALSNVLILEARTQELQSRAQALLGHPSDNALEEILSTLETLFSK